VIPIRDDNPHFLTPYATLALIGINLAVWSFLQGLGSEPALSNSVCTLGAVPAELIQTAHAGTTFKLSTQTLCITGPDPVWHTLITASFLHGGWLHLIGNMWFLWVFGNNVEDSMGPLRFTIFYLACGLIAVGFQIAASQHSLAPIVGASGAIGGVMGGYIVLYPRVHIHMLIFLGFYITTIAVPALWMLGYWLLLQLLGGLGSVKGEGEGVAFWAHFGGFAAGMLLAPLFKSAKLLEQHPYHGWKAQGLPSEPWQRVEQPRR
jgi:membrane associated rhomboid family serine protease